MKKWPALGTLLLLLSLYAPAQTTEDSVKTVVDKLFSAMKGSDGAAIREVFADSALLQSVAPLKEGGFTVKNEAIPDFAASIAKLPKGAADERIRYETIKTDGPLAIVWTPYQFYYNGQFSHCGVNSFQLVRIRGAWKIQYIIDTRRKGDCK